MTSQPPRLPRGRLLSRRALIAAGLGLPVAALLGACGEDGGVLATVLSPTPTPSATPTPAPTEAAPPGTLVAGIGPSQVGQGESAVVVARQAGAAGGSVRFLGQHYPLYAASPGIEGGGETLLWGVVGVALAEPLGPQVATVRTRTRAGRDAGSMDVPFEVVHVDRPVDHLVASEAVTSVLTAEAAETEAAIRQHEQFNRFQARPLWDGTFRMPVEGVITTQFGQGRSINGGPVGGFHGGTDIANNAGTPILAPAPGRIVWTGPMPIHGNTALLDHGAGVVTGYHHQQQITSKVGDVLATGDQIGLMGTTGFSTGPHLHWEMTIFGVNVDALTWTHTAFTPALVG